MIGEDGRVDWVADFYTKQYEWADWRRRWSEFDSDDRDLHVDAVIRHAGSQPLRILELGSGTGTTAAALAVAGHDVVAMELLGELAAHTQELAAVVTGGSLRTIAGDFYEIEPPGKFDVVVYFDGFGERRGSKAAAASDRRMARPERVRSRRCVCAVVLGQSCRERGGVPQGERSPLPRRVRRGRVSDD